MAAALIPVVGAFAAAAAAATDGSTQAVANPTAPTSTHSPNAPATTSPATTSPSPAAPAAGHPNLHVAPAVATHTQAPAPLPASVTDGAVPAINYRAYKAAADTIARTEPRCGIDWRLIAGIGKVESHHANNGDTDANGRLLTPIFGPTLDGTLAGNQVITDTDGGRLDGDAVHDRAVGPMQFIPATWEKYAADGNGDGVVDPQNVFDAALTTARYLCDGGLDLRDTAAETTAVLRYNNSMTYVSNVLGYADGY